MSSAPVYAGHWSSPDYTYSGTTTSVASGNTTTLDWAVEGGTRNGSSSASEYYPGSITIDGTVTTKWTWMPDNPADTAPPEIWVEEGATADWKAEACALSSIHGSRSLSIGGTVLSDTNEVLNMSASPINKTGSISKLYVHKITVTGGVAEVSCNLKTECHGGGPMEPNDTQRSTSLSAGVAYRVKIIATPYDFKIAQGYPQMPGNGVLDFQYTWKSTTGNLTELSDVFVYEHVDYPGGTPTYYPPNAPFKYFHHNPTDYRFDGYALALREEHGNAGTFATHGVDTHNHGALLNAAGTYTSTQEFRWHKEAVHGPLANGNYDVMKGLYGESHPITRTVTYIGGGYYRYSVSKHFFVAELIYQ